MEIGKCCQCNYGNGQKITLRLSCGFTKISCELCGAEFDTDGIDFCLFETEKHVCDHCAQKYAPEIVTIKRIAYDFAEHEKALQALEIQKRIKYEIYTPIETRIMKAIKEICKEDDDIPF